MKVLFDWCRDTLLGKGKVVEDAVELASIRMARFLENADHDYDLIKVPRENYNQIEVDEVIVRNGSRKGDITWKIETDVGEKYVYAELSKEDGGDYDSEHWIVMVKSRYFYAIWHAGLGQPNGDTSYPPKIEEVFGKGKYSDYDKNSIWTKENPVKVPKIGNNFALSDYCHLGFVNGRHRVLWLISKGATVFPVEVRTQEAALKLHDLVGMEGYAPERLLTFHSELSGM